MCSDGRQSVVGRPAPVARRLLDREGVGSIRTLLDRCHEWWRGSGSRGRTPSFESGRHRRGWSIGGDRGGGGMKGQTGLENSQACLDEGSKALKVRMTFLVLQGKTGLPLPRLSWLQE